MYANLLLYFQLAKPFRLNVSSAVNFLPKCPEYPDIYPVYINRKAFRARIPPAIPTNNKCLALYWCI